MHFIGAKFSPQTMLLLKHKKIFSSHGCFLTNASSQRINLIRLTRYDETKKMADDSQIVRAKENA